MLCALEKLHKESNQMGKSIKFKICQRSVRHDAILKSCEIIFDQLGDCRQEKKTSPYLIVFTHHNTLCFHYKCSVISVLFAVLLTYNLAKMRCFFGPFLSFCSFFSLPVLLFNPSCKKTKHPPPLLKKKTTNKPTLYISSNSLVLYFLECCSFLNDEYANMFMFRYISNDKLPQLFK